MARPKMMHQRIGVSVQQNLADKIDEWRSGRRPIPNQCEAIRQLIEIGLEAAKAEERTEGGAQA